MTDRETLHFNQLRAAMRLITRYSTPDALRRGAREYGLGYEKAFEMSIGTLMIEQALQRADRAAASGDVAQMLRAYEELKNLE